LEEAAPEIIADLRAGKLKLGAVNEEVLKKPKDQQAKSLKEQKEARRAKAAKKAQEKKSGGKPKTPEANQRMVDVDAFVTKWNCFDEMQREAFVAKCECKSKRP